MEEFNTRNYDKAGLPPIIVQGSESVRIETRSKEYCENLFKELSGLKFNKVVVGERIQNNFFSFSTTVEKYLTRNSNLDKSEIDHYCYRMNISPDTTLNRLTCGQKSAIDLLSLKKESSFFLLNTSGMYFSCLQVCNEIMEDILANGGACLEITYPPYEGEFLNKELKNKRKIIRL